ncbi:MAG: type III secretion system chaperone [Desulfobacter sp.]|nr:MAG: type III secretion system chaperone [Desulfobacter sp.]
MNEKTEQLFLYSNIGDIPKDVNTELYEKLLEGNFLFQGTSGGTIGMDKTAGIFSLAWQGPFIEMGAAAFEMILENFVNLTEHWRGIVKDLSSSPGSGDSLPGFPQGIRV